jgi:hypothetical protein
MMMILMLNVWGSFILLIYLLWSSVCFSDSINVSLNSYHVFLFIQALEVRMDGMSDLADKARCEVVRNHANVSIEDVAFWKQESVES